MIHTRHFTSSLAIRDNSDGRTLVGPLLPWSVPARVVDQGRLVTETFERGALAGTDPGRVPLTATHPRDAGTLPIGVTLSIDNRADAAWGEWHLSDTMIGTRSWPWPATGYRSGCRSGSPRSPAVAADLRIGNGWSGRGPRLTMLRWSGNPPTSGPGSWASVMGSMGAPPRYSSPCSAAMGKSRAFYTTPFHAGRRPARCLGCRKPITYGDRCPPCATEVRTRAAKRRRKR